MLFDVKVNDIHAIAAGSNAAFCRIYDKYNSIMYRYAYSILKDHQAAEDIVQDSLICILKNAAKYKEGNEKAWIMSIVHNLSVNYIKKKSRELPIEQVSPTSHPDGGMFYEIMELIPDETDRQIVTLRIAAQYKIKEIAVLLGMTPNNVTKRYRKTLKLLKENLKFN